MKEVLDQLKNVVNTLEMKLANKQDSNKVELASLPAGSRFKTDIGNFIVLEQLEGATKVITENFFKKNVFFDDNTPDYKVAAVRKLFDGKILEDFSKVFGADNIIEHEADLTTVDMQKDYGTVTCKVRPLTFDEVRKYNNMLVNRSLPDWWWTCTPWSVPERGWSYYLTVVSPSGIIFNSDCGDCIGVRPFCILKSNIFVSKED